MAKKRKGPNSEAPKPAPGTYPRFSIDVVLFVDISSWSPKPFLT
jgi:hypothetical protein